MIHVDQDEFATTPHRTHLCHGCGNLWRPYPVATVGVDVHADCRERIKTLEADSIWLRASWQDTIYRNDDITRRRDELLKQATVMSEKSEQLIVDARRIMDRDEAIIKGLNEDNDVLRAENQALLKRRDELLELCAKSAREAPYSGELEECKTGRAALIAEVGTLRSRIAQLEDELARAGGSDW